jgi:hypothetical protein
VLQSNEDSDEEEDDEEEELGWYVIQFLLVAAYIS